MANVDAPRGFKCVGALHGRPPQQRTYYIPSGDSTATFIGDAVKSGGTATADGYYATVAQATAAAAIRGVVIGFDQVRGISDANFNLYRKHRPASIGMYCNVIDDPKAIYEIQCDDDSATLAAADIGLNADLIVGTGDSITGMSAMELDTSTKNTTATLQLRILAIVSRQDNTVAVANQKVLVKINNHELESGTGTAGV
jgi:hypothetical protein